MNVAIMIPARAGSKRIKNKNLRLLSGKPLISYVIETTKECGIPIYVNSDSEDILELAKEMGINTYKRSKKLSNDNATNDEFMLDFMEHINADYVLQVLPTSPFIKKEEIKSFLKDMETADTVISVKDEQIGCVYKNQPINFKKTKRNPPSQEMEPIKVYATSLMGWKSEIFKKNMKKLGSAYHGGNGNIIYHTLKGWSTIDIDNEEDFRLAETIAQFIPFEDKYEAFYYEKGSYTDYIVPRVLKDDGIELGVLNNENEPVVSITKLMKQMPDDKAWYHTLVNTENNSCTIVNQMPGEGNRIHFHAKWNEWWYITRGKWLFEIEDKNYEVVPGDLVFIKKGKKHCITALGESIASRLAVSRYDVEHVYNKKPTR